MGVAGVAWATFLCQGVSCVLAVLALFRTLSRMEAEERPRLFSRRILVNLVKIALPSTLQQCFVSVGNIMIQSIINGFGTSAIAGYAAAIKFNNFAVTSFTTMGNGMSNFTAQNLGARRCDRVREGYRGCLKMMALIATAFAAVYVLLGDQVIPSVPQRRKYPGAFCRQAVFARGGALLLCGSAEGGHRWRAAWRWPHGRVHDRYLHRPGPACGAVVCAFGASGPAGRMVELAGQLGGGHNSGHCILPAESLGQAGTRRCLSKRKKDEQNTCVFEERHVK